MAVMAEGEFTPTLQAQRAMIGLLHLCCGSFPLILCLYFDQPFTLFRMQAICQKSGNPGLAVCPDTCKKTGSLIKHEGY